MAPRPRLGVALLLAAAAACQTDPGPAPEPSAARQAPAPTTHRYGDRISTAATDPLASVLSKPTAYQDRAVTVEGAVRRACTKRGCWMELAPGMDASLPGCRVRFKDYGFFVPTDSAGAHARVQGVVQVRQLAAPIVGHMESEGAHFASKNADGTADEVQLVASGVELSR